MFAPSIDVVIQNALDQVRGAWHFRWLALGVAWCVALVLWTFVFLIPDTYQAAARVFVDTHTALSEVTRGISVAADLDIQIQRVRQALLGGPQLQKVAEEAGLLKGISSPRAQQVELNRLRAAIEITGGIAPAAGVFTISYKNHSRDKSLEVVKRLLDSFVEGALGGKHQGSAQAQQFLVNEITDYERRLSAAEERLADFKRHNVGLMPGTEGDYFSTLQAEMDALTKAQESLEVTERRRDDLQRELRGEIPVLTAAKTTNSSSEAAPDTATQIRETRAKLDTLRLRFTDRHPDVIALREALEELEQRQQAEIDAVKSGDVAAANRLGLAANPIYQSVQLQYDQVQVDIGALQTQIARLQTKIANLRSLINTAPEVEAEFARLNRDYDVTRVQYRALLERLEHSRVGEQAEATGIVKFEVIEPPAVSFSPISPKRSPLLAGAFMVAVAAGAGVAYVMSLLKPVFLSTRQLAAVTGLPVAGAVNMARLKTYRARHHMGIALYLGTAAALFFVAMEVLLRQELISALFRSVLA
jgi:polysaccharide chain length determinant protein (PEP-CTERM system associated)